MAEQSFTGTINTNGEFEDVATLASVTFSSGKFYTLYVGGQAEVKIADAIFPVNNEVFYIGSYSSPVYIKNNGVPTSLTVYGAE